MHVRAGPTMLNMTHLDRPIQILLLVVQETGHSTVGKNCLKQNTCSGTYGAEYKEPKEPRHYWDDWGYDVQYAADVLLRRRLDA